MGTMLLMGAGPGSPSATLWLDHFTDADTTLLPPHAPDIGSGGYTANQGTIEVLSNQAVGNTFNTHNIVTGNTAASDVTITGTAQVDLKASGSGTIGFVARFSALSAFVTAYFNITGGGVFIFNNGNTFNQLATAAFTFNDSTSYALKATFSGSTVTMFINGSQVLQATGVTQNQTVTRHGLDMFSNVHNTHLDDFQITSP